VHKGCHLTHQKLHGCNAYNNNHQTIILKQRNPIYLSGHSMVATSSSGWCQQQQQSNIHIRVGNMLDDTHNVKMSVVPCIFVALPCMFYTVQPFYTLSYSSLVCACILNMQSRSFHPFELLKPSLAGYLETSKSSLYPFSYRSNVL